MVVKKTSTKKKADVDEASKPGAETAKPKKKPAASTKKVKKVEVVAEEKHHIDKKLGLMAPTVRKPPVIVVPPPAVKEPVVTVKPAASPAPVSTTVQPAVTPTKKTEATSPSTTAVPPTVSPAAPTPPSMPAQKAPPPVKKAFVAPIPAGFKPKPVPPPVTPRFAPFHKGPSAPKKRVEKRVVVEEKQVPVDVEPLNPERKKINFHEMMTVKDFSEAMGVKTTDVIKKLIGLGTLATINQRIDYEQAVLVADGFNCDVELKSLFSEEAVEVKDNEVDLLPRAPVVTVMGHVDHGKTSLLDAIRSADVAKGEAGGITQHIGAYQVKTTSGVITFLDTPGHEAFSAMRARGADVTDLVVLVVAADDAVMPQTIEAIDHAKAAKVPIVVAINKTDLPQANVQRVKQELSQHDLLAEDWGGKTVMVEVSAKTQKNIDKLLEMILLETELMELKANPNRTAQATVLEARLDPKRGITATVLIQNGTLKQGDVVMCGLSYGRVRAMLDEHGRMVKEALPSTPVALLGLNQVPQVGDQLTVMASEKDARDIVERRQQSVQDSKNQKNAHMSLESLHSHMAQGDVKDLPIILKADMQGSLQAIQDSLGKLAHEAIKIRFVHMAVGSINQSDVLLAEAADAIVFGFNVKMDSSAEEEAKLAGIDVRTYTIIYEMLDEVKAAMEGLLKPVDVETVKARALVKGVFASSNLGQVAGCLVQEGKVNRGAKARVLRGGQVVGNGSISSLRRFKEDVKEVDRGFECGLSIDGFKGFQANDIVETFIIEKKARRLEG